MNQWLGKRCQIEIKKNGSLFFTADVINCSENTITFKDRKGDLYTFNENQVIQIHESEV